MFIVFSLIMLTSCSIYSMSEDFNENQKDFMHIFELYADPTTLEEATKIRDGLERFLTWPRGSDYRSHTQQLVAETGLESRKVHVAYYMATSDMPKEDINKTLFIYKQ